MPRSPGWKRSWRKPWSRSKTETEAYDLLDFTSSGSAHINESYATAANEYRVAGPLVDLNFGLVEIDWTAKASPQVMLKAITEDGSESFMYRISLDSLR